MNTMQVVTVRDVMVQDYLLIAGMSTVMDVINLLRESSPKPVVVDKLHEEDEYGLLLMSDIVAEVLAKDRAPDRVNVYEIMKKPVISVRPEMDIRNCAKLFSRYSVTHAPVIENKQLIGIVSMPKLALDGLAKHFSV